MQQRQRKSYVISSIIVLLLLLTSMIYGSVNADPIQIPDYNGKLVIEINNDEPFFTEAERTLSKPFETYSDLDALGRCGSAYALITKDTMPTEKRGDISSVHPSGWVQAYYDDKHAYERCHLIAFMLAGENANPKNLVTGTHDMNVEGMLPYEAQISQYVNQFNGSVLYRVTPVFEGDNLVCKGVLMEAYSKEYPQECTFCVFVYNYSDDFEIDYKTGQTSASNTSTYRQNDSRNQDQDDIQADDDKDRQVNPQNTLDREYVLNTNTMKFHTPSCSSVSKIKDENRQNYLGQRNNLIAAGYSPCGNCDP